MCLKTLWHTPRIAGSNIIVYKRFSSFYPDAAKSCIKGFEYIFNKLYKTCITIGDNNEASYDGVAGRALDTIDNGEFIRTIKEGFHSSLTAERLDTVSASHDYILKCIIPKDSEYYIGLSGLVVSNQIIVTNEKFTEREYDKTQG